MPAKCIHLSLPPCAKPAERDRRQEHRLGEVTPRGEKWRVSESGENVEEKNAKKRKASYLLQLLKQLLFVQQFQMAEIFCV